MKKNKKEQSRAHRVQPTRAPHPHRGAPVVVHVIGAKQKEKSKEKKVVTLGIEPKTNGLLDQRSTNWATRPGYWEYRGSSGITTKLFFVFSVRLEAQAIDLTVSEWW